jgi:predicted nucleic acid-binding protein
VTRARPPCRAAYAFVTLPAFRQRVQTYTRRGAPATSMRTRWRFGSKRRFVATLEWLRLCPKAGPLLQTWQTFGMARGSIRRALARARRGSHAPGVSHRVKPVDLLIAAVASSEGLGVLHYDGDYDTIAEHTSLRFASVWVAPQGSID